MGSGSIVLHIDCARDTEGALLPPSGFRQRAGQRCHIDLMQERAFHREGVRMYVSKQVCSIAAAIPRTFYNTPKDHSCLPHPFLCLIRARA